MSSARIVVDARPRYRRRVGLVEEAATLGGKLARIRPALYHAPLWPCSGRSPVPLVAMAHDLIPWALGGWRLLGERWRWWLGRLLRRTALTIALSECTARDAKALAGVREDRLVVIPEASAPGFAPAEGGPRTRGGAPRADRPLTEEEASPGRSEPAYFVLR
jgi:hypothetical protein